MDDFWVRQWHQFVFVMVNQAPMVFLGTLAITVLGLGPIGRAVAARIRHGPGGVPADPAIDEVRQGMTELQERLDFSERMLSDVREHILEPGKPVEPREPRRVITPR